MQAYGKVAWDVAVESPRAERDYMTTMADLGGGTDDLAVSTAAVVKLLGRKPQSLDPHATD